MHTPAKNELYAFVTFVLMLFVSILVLKQGVNETFYFDDYVNLDALAAGGGVTNAETARQFIFGNGSGALGRPVSMASFLLDDNAWPSDASSFKNTNILIHAIVGLLVFWLSYLLICIRYPQHAAGYALLVAAAWLFNPLHVSTVLYSVQRMAQLSALFSLAGLICYVKARQSLHYCQIGRGLFGFFGVGVFFVLSIYAKENGVLLPAMILVIDLWLAKSFKWPITWLMMLSRALVYTGTLLIFGYVVYSILVSGFWDTYPGRTFSPYERLITQPFVLWFYIKELFVPSLFTTGFYYDDFIAFKSIFDSPRAYLSVVALAGLALSGAWMLRRGIFTGLAICLFLVGHLLESSALNLELIFEHRNYLPGVLIGFVWLDILLLAKKKFKILYVLIVIPLVIYPLFTWERSTLWQNDLVFGKYLSVEKPFSVRSQIEYNNALLRRDFVEEAQSAIGLALEKNPESVYLGLHAVLVQCLSGDKETEKLGHLLYLAKNNKFDARHRLIFEEVYEHMHEARCAVLTPKYFSELLDNFLSHEDYERERQSSSSRLLERYSHIFYLNYPQYYPHEISISRKIMDSGDPEYLMNTAALMASKKRFQEALMISEEALQLVRSERMGSSNRRPEVLERMIVEFQDVVQKDIENQ